MMYYYCLDIDEYSSYEGWDDLRIITNQKKYSEEKLQNIIEDEKKNAETLLEMFGILHDKYGFYIAPDVIHVSLETDELGMEYHNTIQKQKDEYEAEAKARDEWSRQRFEMTKRILDEYIEKQKKG